MKILISLTGATGAIYGIRLLEYLQTTEHETALILSRWAKETIAIETNYTVKTVEALADKIYDETDLTAAVAGGSYGIDAHIIAPCSMKTLAGIANGYSDNLILRCGDVALKERKKLILMTRETPLSLIHINNMATVTAAGGIILPPVPAFYHHPETVDDIINQSIGKVLDLLNIKHSLFRPWEGK